MAPEDRSFWVWLALWGGALLAVFAAGLALIFGDKPYPGALLSGGSLIGIAFLARWLVHRKPLSSPVIMAAMIVSTWAFIGYDLYDRHFGNPSHVARGRLWSPMTDDQEALLERALSKFTKRSPILIICMSADCRELAGNFIGAFHNSGWEVRGAFSGYPQEPIGLVLYQVDVNDHSLADAIQTSTGLKIERIDHTSIPDNESLFIGIRP
jgi:hypothetical protein